MARCFPGRPFILAVMFVLILSSMEANAAPGDLTLVSTSTAGVKGNSTSFNVQVSADGDTVAFQSFAGNLDPGDTDFEADVYVKRVSTGVLTLASTNEAGTKGSGFNGVPDLSADGTRVAFTSTAANLDPADTDDRNDVYVKDLTTGALILASTNSAGEKSNGFNNNDPALSADGTKVVWWSDATNLDPRDADVNWDVYVKDLTTGATTLVSVSLDNSGSNNSSQEPHISGDGTKVAFHSAATNLHLGDTDSSFDIYVKDLTTGTLILASTSTIGAKGNGQNQLPAISSDGSAVAFFSESSNLDAGDTDATEDVYVKDLGTGSLTLASTNGSGTKGNGISWRPSLSGDGELVSFDSTATNLDPSDTDPLLDVYVKNLATGDLSLVSTSDSNIKGNGHSSSSKLTVDGGALGFDSVATNLEPSDDDPNTDVYLKELGTTGPVAVGIGIKKVGPPHGGQYRVAIFSDGTFDASTVDAGSVCFGDAEDPAARDCTHARAPRIWDADGDGDLDIVLAFEAVQTGIDPGDTQACLTGETTAGVVFAGCGALKAPRR